MKKKRKKLDYCWTEKEMDFVQKEIVKAKKDLNLHEWLIECTYRDGNMPTKGDTAINAQIKTSPEYLRAYIWFYPTLLKNYRDMGKKYLRDTIRHEVSHILTEEIYTMGLDRFTNENELNDAREKLTERIARLIKDV